jgi:hypothetical protein
MLLLLQHKQPVNMLPKKKKNNFSAVRPIKWRHGQTTVGRVSQTLAGIRVTRTSQRLFCTGNRSTNRVIAETMMATGDFVLTPVGASRQTNPQQKIGNQFKPCLHCSCSSATGRDTGGRISARLNHAAVL